MARPRKYVNRTGRVVKTNTGISYNRARGRYYIIRENGTRQEFRTWDEANAALAAQKADSIPPEELARIAAAARYRSDLAHQELAKRAVATDGPTIDGPVIIQASHAEIVTRFATMADAMADKLEVPRFELEEERDQPLGGPRLRDVIRKWAEHKRQGGAAETRHQGEVQRRWKNFEGQVGNLFVGQLQPGHFRKFHAWVAKEGGTRSTKWSRDQAAAVKSVIQYVRRRYPEWPWPALVVEWADSYDAQPYQPAASNREPTPVEEFARLLEQCKSWTMEAVSAHDATTQAGRALRLQVKRRNRDGVQYRAILLLALNCGLDPVDIERVAWGDLKLDMATPHLRMPRRKVEKMIGSAVDRITPMLPSTVDALRAWQSYEPVTSTNVFRTVRGARMQAKHVSAGYARLKKAVGLDSRHTFKHLRNVGVTLARRARLSSDEREAFLGHVVRGTSRFYEGDVDESYLTPLVNLIGQHYLNGEAVSTP